MNPGVIEETGQTARTMIDSLKSTPVVLALVIFNCLYLGFGAWQAVRAEQNRSELLKAWADEHRSVAELLSKCIVPSSGFKLQSDESRPVELK